MGIKDVKPRIIHTAQGASADNVAEDMSMVIETAKGLVVLTGCGHAGIVNTISYTQQQFPGQQIVAVIGGMHLLDSNDRMAAVGVLNQRLTGSCELLNRPDAL